MPVPSSYPACWCLGPAPCFILLCSEQLGHVWGPRKAHVAVGCLLCLLSFSGLYPSAPQCSESSLSRYKILAPPRSWLWAGLPRSGVARLETSRQRAALFCSLHKARLCPFLKYALLFLCHGAGEGHHVSAFRTQNGRCAAAPVKLEQAQLCWQRGRCHARPLSATSLLCCPPRAPSLPSGALGKGTSAPPASRTLLPAVTLSFPGRAAARHEIGAVALFGGSTAAVCHVAMSLRSTTLSATRAVAGTGLVGLFFLILFFFFSSHFSSESSPHPAVFPVWPEQRCTAGGDVSCSCAYEHSKSLQAPGDSSGAF